MPRRDVPVVERPAHRDVPLVPHGHGGEDRGAEGHVVQRVDDEGEQVQEQGKGAVERPVKTAVFYMFVLRVF